MASQPPDTGRDRNQVRPLRSTVSSVRGKADRHRSTGVFWITFCSGLRRISKTSCSISGPTSTTIARIPPWKGERRIGLPHDQSQISASFDGNLTVDPYIRHQWLRDFPKTLELRYPVNLGKTSNSIIWCLRSWLLCASRIRSFHSNRINSPETGTEGAVVTLSSGKQYVIPSPWSNGLAFTPDFRFAVPLWTEGEKLGGYPFTLACDRNS